VEFSLDEMQPDDWEQVREIYMQGLATGQASFEVDAPTWNEWDKSHHRHSRLVVRRQGSVVAWGALTPVSPRKCYAGVAEISVYVRVGNRGQGVGKKLLQALIESSEQHGIWTLYGSTFPENSVSIQMQLDCGFRVVGLRERIARHHEVWRDTVITERRSKVVGVEDTSRSA
jgi:L-amino acid N-acyltransferase YncA